MTYQRLPVALALVLTVCSTTGFGQSAADVAALMREPAVERALAAARRDEPRTVDDQVRFCEVPAPPFEEAARADLLRRAFVDAGLINVRSDRAGNVLGDRRGASARPHVVVAAHLDTVFPPGTDVRVTRDGSVLRGPGIGDNCRGLAVLVRIARVLREGGVRTPGTITFVANVGEEGLGDLRGMKALFGETLEGQIDRFVSIDGAGIHVTHVAVGSRRYRATFKGPGGHSYAAFGLPNPIGALGRAAAALSALQVPANPRTTFNVGRIGGGTSVNAIPFDAWMEVDLRSPDAAALAALVERFEAIVWQAVADENARWGRAGVVSVDLAVVGDRPAGMIAADAPIIATARAAARALGLTAPMGEGSTDANLPISLGIPAVTIGGGGTGSGAHALDETFTLTNAWEGTVHAVLLTVALAQP